MPTAGARDESSLRYGCVAADSRPSAGQGLHRVLVEVEDGRHRDILSSQLYSFR
jgi:hypothetical protein